MYTMRYFILLLIVLFSEGTAFGQVFPSRKFIIAPEFRSSTDTNKGAVFLRQQGIWGDISKGFNSAGDRFYWSIATGGIIQFVEWQHSAIYLIGDYEMAADQHSSIYFHPRAIYWTEGFLYMNKVGEIELHAGYINRCHHDVDNLATNIVGRGEQRTLIYSSILERAIWRNVNLGGIASALWAQADEYVFTQDFRIPDLSQKSATDVSRIIASLSFGGKFSLPIGQANTYARVSAITSAYNTFKTISVDARAEVGVEFIGMGSVMNIFIGAEALQDDYSRPIPVNSKYVYLGFRFIGKNIGL